MDSDIIGEVNLLQLRAHSAYGVGTNLPPCFILNQSFSANRLSQLYCFYKSEIAIKGL